jgi:MFS family permease
MSRAEPPEGYRSTVSALACGQILSWAVVYYAFSSFVLPMMADLGWSKATVMGANTLGLAVWGLTTYAAGAAVDRGHARTLMGGGCALAACGLAIWALATEPWMLYAAWVLLGAASSATLYEPAFNVLTRRFPTRYREGITTLTLVGGFASTVSFPAVAGLIQLVGWRGALWCLAAVMGLVLVPLHWWALRGPSVAASAQAQDPQDTATLRQALHTPAFWLLTLCFTLYAVIIAALWAHAMPMFASKGLSEAQSLAILVWIGPAQVLGRFVFALRGRGASLRKLGIVVLAAMPVSMLMLALGERLWVLIAAAVLYGIANGLVTIVRGGLVPEYFGRAHIGRIGGAMSAIGLVARAIGPLAVAWWLAWVPGYASALLALGALGAIALLLFALAHKPPAFAAPAPTLGPMAFNPSGAPSAAAEAGANASTAKPDRRSDGLRR